MRRADLVLAVLLLSSPAAAQSGSGAGTLSTGGVVSFGTATPRTTTQCLIKIRSGNITTEGCNFSLPLSNPVMTPKSSSDVDLSFEQSSPYAVISVPR